MARLTMRSRGLEADQKVIAAHGCYAMTATTALTAQNTQGVYDVHEVPPAFLRKQIDACLDDIGVDVVKTGEAQFTSTGQSLRHKWTYGKGQIPLKSY
jgi:ATP-dependent RNA helicase DDX5/DBP2